MKTFLFLLFSFFLSAASAQVTSYTVLADSLRLPAGLETDAQGRIWITESGYGFNDGAVSLLLPDGNVWPVIVGLPSFFDTTTQEGVGPWHTLALPQNRIAVTVGASGQVLIFDLTGFVPGVSAPMTAANAEWVLEIRNFVLGEGLLESNTYSVAADAAGNLYVADAAANAIVKSTPSGQLSVFATFPDFPNPLPFGPPTVDAVPTRIIAKPGGGFYVCQLTGFPFLDGASNVFALDSTGTVSVYASGLTQLTDLAVEAGTGDLYALQVGHFVLDPMQPPGYAPNSATITRIRPNGTREVVAQNFDLSAGMALDAQGNIYTTELGNGRLLKWDHLTTGIRHEFSEVHTLSVFPNPATAAGTSVTFNLATAATVEMRVVDASGRVVTTQQLGRLNAGPHQTEWNAGNCPAGTYWIEIQTEQGRVARAVVKM